VKAYTDITILLDRSGSMIDKRAAMEKAYADFIEGHRVNPSTKVTLIQFDDKDDQEVVYEASPVKVAGNLHLSPRGWTPLYDAMCKAIDNTGRRLGKMAESERPDQVLMVVITDGGENHSKTYTRSDVRSRVTHQTDRYNWQFVYLGANPNAMSEATSYGIPSTHAIKWSDDWKGAENSMRSLTANTIAYSNSGMRGQSVQAFTEAQRVASDEEHTLNLPNKKLKKRNS
jgi:hypothetical protein